MALYALDNELARIQRVVREPMAGLIRLQWWDDIIDGFERGNSVANPVVAELKRAVIDGGLEASYLTRAIDGRRRPYEEDQPPSLASFQRYLIDIGGSVTSAAAALLGIGDKTSLTVTDRIGTARAVLEKLNFLEHAASDQRRWLPSVWLSQQGDERHNVVGADLPSGPPITNLLAELGLAELAKGRAEMAPVRRHQLSAFFPATLAGMRLKNRLHASNSEKISNGALTLTLSWLRGRF